MEEIMLGIAVVNFAASIIFLISAVSKKQKIGLTIYFMVFPVMGFVIYYLPQWILNIRKQFSYDRESLVKRFDIEQVQSVPVVEKELNIVPIADAMAVSSNAEKRLLLLEQLKKDIHTNYKVVLPAGKDSDSESAHYVAAAKMEVYRGKQEKIGKMRKQMEKEPENAEYLREYLKELTDYIESDLLTEREAELYKADYCNRLEHAKRKTKVTGDEYNCYVMYLVDLKRYKEAEAFWKKFNQCEGNEMAYRKMLQMYYDVGDKQKFYTCLDGLRRSAIKLSPEGLKILRYWTERRE